MIHSTIIIIGMESVTLYMCVYMKPSADSHCRPCECHYGPPVSRDMRREVSRVKTHQEKKIKQL